MPVWKDHNLLSKSSWSGSLDSMQYFSTVIPEDADSLSRDRIMWLPRDKIEDQMQDTTPMLGASNPEAMPELVGSGQTAGGVVSQVVGGATSAGGCHDGLDGEGGATGTVGGGGLSSPEAQLQRIVSRCKCEFYYVAYGDKPIDEVVDAPDKVPKKPEETPWSTDSDRPLVNSFSLIHHDCDVCTNRYTH